MYAIKNITPHVITIDGITLYPNETADIPVPSEAMFVARDAAVLEIKDDTETTAK